jgi:hypothetical protein
MIAGILIVSFHCIAWDTRRQICDLEQHGRAFSKKGATFLFYRGTA